MSSYVYCLYRVEADSIQTPDSLSSICRDSIPEMLARHLRIWNAAFAVLHAGQGAAIVLLANDFAILVTVSFLEGPPGGGSRKPPSFPHLTSTRSVPAFVRGARCPTHGGCERV